MKLKEFDWALVTGASSGIGRELAVELAKRGINIVAVGRDKDRLEKTVDQCRTFKVETKACLLDLSVQENVEKLIEVAKDVNIDLLINNAGVGLYGEFARLNYEEIERMINLNIKALTRLSHFFARKMAENRRGGIINVASIAGHLPIPYFNVYAATKAYVYSFSISLWAELKKYNIHVMCVSPGPTETMFFERAFKGQVFRKFSALMKPSEVAAGALKAFEKNKVIYVPGVKNKFITHFAAKLFPHKSIAKLLTIG